MVGTVKASGQIWTCDYVNDEVQIQAAIDSLPANRNSKEWVEIRGTLHIDGVINVPAYTGLDMYGAYINQGANIGAIFQSDNWLSSRQDQVHFRGGHFSGSKATYTTGSCIRGCFRQSDFEDLHIYAFDYYGIWIQSISGLNADANRFTNCEIGKSLSETGCARGGVFFDDSAGGTVNDNIFLDCYFINNGQANVLITNGAVNRFTGCHFAGISADTLRTVGVWISGSQSLFQFVNNHFENIDKQAILMDNGFKYGILIQGNTFKACGRYANNTYAVIEVGTGGSDNLFYGNIIGNHFYSVEANKANYCVWLKADTLYWMVSGNIIHTGSIYTYGDLTPYSTAAMRNDGTANILIHNITGSGA